MASVTWIGDDDPAAQTIRQGGHVFVKGVPVEMRKEEAEKFASNPTFSFEKDAEPTPAIEPEVDAEAGSERGRLKDMLDNLGVEYRANASLESLRSAVAKALADKPGATV